MTASFSFVQNRFFICWTSVKTQTSMTIISNRAFICVPNLIFGTYMVMFSFDSACDIDESDRFVLMAGHTIPTVSQSYVVTYANGSFTHFYVFHGCFQSQSLFHALKLNFANETCLLNTKLIQASSGLPVSHNNQTCCMAPDGDGSFKIRTHRFRRQGIGQLWQGRVTQHESFVRENV